MNKEYYLQYLESESAFIASLTMSNGAIGMNRPSVSSYTQKLPEVDGVAPSVYTSWKSVKVVPYFSLSACRGIIMASQATESDLGRQTVLNFINWYIAHMNTAESDINGVKGTIYDYFVFENPTNGQIIEVTLHDAYASNYTNQKDNPYDYDSTDSYAALFLEVLYEYTRVFDNTFLDDKKELIATLVDVIMATYIPNLGLTGAKPNYMVCYLMDNCEVYRGLISAANIYDEFISDNAAKASALDTAEKVKNAILTRFWKAGDKAFTAGIFENGAAAYKTDAEALSRFYPEASAQLFPIIFGILEPTDEKAVAIYDRFVESYCQEGVSKRNWVKLDHSDAYPWVTLSRAVVAMGDYERATAYFTNLLRAYSNHTSYYYYNAEAGQLLLVFAELYKIASPQQPQTESSQAESSQPVESNVETSSPPVEQQPPSNSLLYIGIGAGVAVLAVIMTILIKNRKKGIEK